MKTVFILSFICNIFLSIVAAVISPDKVAIQFGIGGSPNNWASPEANALIMGSSHLLIFVSIYFTPFLIRKAPTSMINLPNKDYWLSEENRKKTELMLSNETCLFGVSINLFFFAIGLLALDANFSTPVKLREDLFWILFGSFLAFTIYWVIRLITKFKVPHDLGSEQISGGNSK